MLDAIKVGREHNLEYVYKGLTPPPVLHMKYKFYEKTIYSLLKKTIGIENGRFFLLPVRLFRRLYRSLFCRWELIW